MADTRYLQFDGLKRPLALEQAAGIEPLLSRILLSWPTRVLKTPPDATAFATIRPAGARKWEVVSADTPNEPRVWNEVNAACDLISDMAWERLRADPDLLCMHAAAVDFGGQLVVFPNVRRAGKSTLAIALARLGMPLYTDDFLPVRLDQSTGACVGIANGVLPRLRLPVPVGFSAAFQNWVAQDTGPSNRQYKYMADLPVARWGQELPLAAMVVLDRRAEPTPPRLNPMAREEALESLITQNFARTRHASALLRSLDTISRSINIYRLSYHCGEAASGYLRKAPDLLNLPSAIVPGFAPDDRQAALDQADRAARAFDRSQRYEQAPRVTETVAGNDCFLADAAGVGIIRLNPMSAAIWRLLKEPTTITDVTELIAAAFPDVAPARIDADCDKLMHDLSNANLIVPARSAAAAE